MNAEKPMSADQIQDDMLSQALPYPKLYSSEFFASHCERLRSRNCKLLEAMKLEAKHLEVLSPLAAANLRAAIEENDDGK